RRHAVGASSMRSSLPGFCAILLAATCAHAIEAPKTQNETAPNEAAHAGNVVPTDEARFYEQLQRVTHWRNLRGLHVPQTAIDDLARGHADRAVAALGDAAAKGSEEANIALVRIHQRCSRVGSARPPNLDEQNDKLSSILPSERAPRDACLLNDEAAF